jgi:3-isopropylmalate/(R)-2-methylmalate dehydratase small subunit
MEKFTKLKSIVVPIDRPNVDTDALIPKQFLKSIKRTGFGPNLFDEWRYLDHGSPDQDNTLRPLNPDFALNQERYQNAGILLARENFGCGSSREHAPWALFDYGIRALLAPSFADIFFSNSCKNGLLPIALPADIIDQLFTEVTECLGYELNIDLEHLTVGTPSGQVISFDFDAGLRDRLLKGMDDISVSLEHADLIKKHEEEKRKIAPWLFN